MRIQNFGGIIFAIGKSVMPTAFWQISMPIIHGINSEATIYMVPMAPIMDHAYGIFVDLHDFFHGINSFHGMNSEATICMVPTAPIMDHAYGISLLLGFGRTKKPNF